MAKGKGFLSPGESVRSTVVGPSLTEVEVEELFKKGRAFQVEWLLRRLFLIASDETNRRQYSALVLLLEHLDGLPVKKNEIPHVVDALPEGEFISGNGQLPPLKEIQGTNEDQDVLR